MAEEVKLGSSKPMIATQQEMEENRVPIPYRDECAHLLIPLNKCRSAEFFLPWKCENERHVYEKCEYELIMERMLQMQKIRELEERKKAQQIQGLAAKSSPNLEDSSCANYLFSLFIACNPDFSLILELTDMQDAK
ncbi:hypothetical protein ZIOFF_061224 [Zingiber officinale]|uniref:NADH dehydrogenase [ubiquinone] 1 beta subcomplex subunit 7 n=1 Tax=Zingiber officinale TaxID=94328 RepID=A0A8J5KI64_ZINOF|nr:hypothetical protein ZIOFF_061224 [Zingiber officinale]